MERIEFDDSLSKSSDILAERRKAMQAVFPGIFADGNLDADLLKEYLGVEPTPEDERFSFTWKGKHMARHEAYKPSYGTLRPVRGQSRDWDTTENIFIDGENLEVLKLLQKSYHGKIDVIYIDPPYNRGEDFIYRDDYHDNLQNYLSLTRQRDASGRMIDTNSEVSGRYHSNWLSMMYPRLMLAHNLMSPNGVIFISIDDHEGHNLRNICNEIFGEENFVTEFVWEKKRKPSFLHRNVGKLMEYIVCYAKNQKNSTPFSIEKTTVGKKYPFNNAGNSLANLHFPPGTVQFDLPDQAISKQNMSKGKIITELLQDVEIKDGTNITPLILRGEWRYSQDSLNEIIEKGEKITIHDIPFRPNHVKPGGEIKKMKNCLTPVHYQMETNEDGTAQLIDLLGGEYFDYPKPVKLIKTLIKAVTYDNPNALVLDFFAGTATCGHAVWKLNRDDGGKRRFILVQLPEPTFFWNEGKKASRKTGRNAFEAGFETVSSIAIKRLDRAASRIYELKQKNQIDQDLGFKIFALDSSNLRTWDPKEDRLPQYLIQFVDQIKPDREQNDLLYEIMLKYGLDLALPVKTWRKGETTVFDLGFGALMLCFDKHITFETVRYIVEIKGKQQPEICRVVFRDNGFESDAAKTNALLMLREAGITDVRSI